MPAGDVQMFGLEPHIVAGLAGALIVGGIVKGVTGIGLPIVTMAISLNFLPAQTVLALLVMPIVATNFYQAASMGNPMAPLRRFWILIVFLAGFLWLGALLVTKLSAAGLFGTLGAAVCVFSAAQFFKPPQNALSPRLEKLTQPLAGMVGGILGGLTTIWGPPMLMYMLMLKLDKDTWVRSIGLIWFMGSLPLTLGYWANGLLNEMTIWLSLAAILPGMAGIKIGERIRDMLNQDRFRKVLLVCMFLIGLNLIRRAVF